MKIKLLIFVLIFGVFFQAEAQKNSYFKYFEFADAKADDNLISLEKGNDPRIILYTNSEDHTQHLNSLTDQGYLKIGTWIGHPTFNNKANKKRAIKEAKKVGATVIFSSNTFIGSDFYVLQKNPPPATTVVEPSTTANTPAQAEMANVGVELRNLTIEERQDIERNKGAYIVNILDDSPAFEANVIPGDILIKVNGLEIKNTEQALLFLKAAGQTTHLTLTIIRKGSTREITVKF